LCGRFLREIALAYFLLLFILPRQHRLKMAFGLIFLASLAAILSRAEEGEAAAHPTPGLLPAPAR
jgi:cbb3-type cytochrome oxidase subunit 3